MTNVVIFDDTVSAFSNPTLLQRVYGVFWDAGVPISLGVTPDLSGISENPSIPQAKHEATTHYRVTNNSILCNYLDVMAEQRLVEICQVGFHGTIDEFGTDDDILLQQKIEEGQAELNKGFPNAELQTVCAPPIKTSETTIQLLTEYDFNICTRKSESLTFTKREALNDSRAIFHYGTYLDRELLKSTPEKMLQAHLETSDYYILRVSYTSFFDNDKPTPDLILWQSFCKKLLALENITVDTFSYI